VTAPQTPLEQVLHLLPALGQADLRRLERAVDALLSVYEPARREKAAKHELAKRMWRKARDEKAPVE
jgi:hypothetical protein